LEEFVHGKKLSTPAEQDRKSLQHIAILYRFPAATGIPEQIEVNSVSCPFDFHGLPLLWLGPADHPASMELLRQCYGQTRTDAALRGALRAASVHDEARLVLPFLRPVLQGEGEEVVRAWAARCLAEAVAFWGGQEDAPAYLELLLHAARHDRSPAVRLQTLYGIGRSGSPAATEALLDLARDADDRAVRKEAIAWLPQQKFGPEQVLAVLKACVGEGEEAEIQKQAVVALAHLPRQQGIPELIAVAKSHARPGVSAEAHLWLKMSKDPRAVEALKGLDW
jgi:HEAT repeat protein